MKVQAAYLFPEAATYPDFFNHHLTDSNRVLKVVTGQGCWARAFYYQLLKIIFQNENDLEKSIDYGEALLSLGKELTQKLDSQQQKSKRAVAVDLISFFISKLKQYPDIFFQDYINQNPDIDQAFIGMFIQILQLSGVYNHSTLQKIKFCGDLFELHAYQFDKGIKFQESDTFLYVEDQKTIYIAFLNQVSQFQGQQTGSLDNVKKSDDIKQQKKQLSRDNAKQMIEVNVEKLSPLEIQQKKQSPVDYLLTNKFRSQSTNQKHQKNQNQQIKEVQIDLKVDSNKLNQNEQATKKQQNNLQFTLGNRSNSNAEDKLQPQPQVFKLLNSKYVKHADTVEQSLDKGDFKSSNRQSIVQQRLLNRSDKYNGFTVNPKDDNKVEQEQLFYKPAQAQINKKQSPSSGRQLKKDAFDIVNQSEKGTFYRKFTDTRILNLISQPYRTKVKMLKNRFIGVHSRNHRTGIIPTQQF